MAGCAPCTRGFCKPSTHVECVEAWYATVPLNTATCLEARAVRGSADHDRCGPHCPGGGSAHVRRRRVLLGVRDVGDDRPN